MLIYLASPYSHPDAAVREERYIATLAFCARAYSSGELPPSAWLYSPIVHFHPMAVRYKMPTDAAFWNAVNLTAMRLAEELWVLQLPGWEESRGVTDERHYWLSKGGVVVYFPPLTEKEEFAIVKRSSS